MDRGSNTRVVVALAAVVFLTAAWAGADLPARSANAGEAWATAPEGSASAVQASLNAWRVDIAADQPGKYTGNAWSPVAGVPEVLADADGDFSSSIRYMCLSDSGGVSFRLQSASIQFEAEPRPVMMEGVQEGERPIPLEVRTTWNGQRVTLQAHVVRDAILFAQTDAADRATRRSSSAEFIRRLLRSGSTGADAVEIELDWEEVGPVGYTFSLEGAADAVREAGRPCRVI